LVWFSINTPQHPKLLGPRTCKKPRITYQSVVRGLLHHDLKLQSGRHQKLCSAPTQSQVHQTHPISRQTKSQCPQPPPKTASRLRLYPPKLKNMPKVKCMASRGWKPGGPKHISLNIQAWIRPGHLDGIQINWVHVIGAPTSSQGHVPALVFVLRVGCAALHNIWQATTS
jgi:hypothetical protein